VKRFAAVVATLVAAGAGLTWWWRSNHRFDPVAWKAAHEGFCKDERARMFGDLRANHLRTGMQQRAVLRLLGKPEYINRRTATGRQVWWSWEGGQSYIDCATLDVLFVNRHLVRSETGHT
jgi:hypothetical protein